MRTAPQPWGIGDTKIKTTKSSNLRMISPFTIKNHQIYQIVGWSPHHFYMFYHVLSIGWSSPSGCLHGDVDVSHLQEEFLHGIRISGNHDVLKDFWLTQPCKEKGKHDLHDLHGYTMNTL